MSVFSSGLYWNGSTLCIWKCGLQWWISRGVFTPYRWTLSDDGKPGMFICSLCGRATKTWTGCEKASSFQSEIITIAMWIRGPKPLVGTIGCKLCFIQWSEVSRDTANKQRVSVFPFTSCSVGILSCQTTADFFWKIRVTLYKCWLRIRHNKIEFHFQWRKQTKIEFYFQSRKTDYDSLWFQSIILSCCRWQWYSSHCCPLPRFCIPTHTGHCGCLDRNRQCCSCQPSWAQWGWDTPSLQWKCADRNQRHVGCCCRNPARLCQETHGTCNCSGLMIITLRGKCEFSRTFRGSESGSLHGQKNWRCDCMQRNILAKHL